MSNYSGDEIAFAAATLQIRPKGQGVSLNKTPESIYNGWGRAFRNEGIRQNDLNSLAAEFEFRAVASAV